MRVLFFYPFDIYKDDSPGAARAIAIATKLTRQHHYVRMVYYFATTTPEIEGTTHKDKFIFETMPFVKYSRTMISKMRRFAELAREADVVHIQTALPDVVIPAIFAAYRAKRPIHLDMVDFGQGEQRYAPALVAAAKKSITSLVDTMTCNDPGVQQSILQGGFKQERLFLLPDGDIDASSDAPTALNTAYNLLAGETA